jgi:glutamyl-Q tRNA(Asp) synthetase
MTAGPASPLPTFRFAPSPNGRLHLGHALSAIIGHEMARRCGGRFLVRIEDIDLTRARDDHVAAIFSDLAWLGLRWETPVLHQSANIAAYQQAADRLEHMGVLYPCFANRSEINAIIANAPNPRDPDGAPMFPARLRGRLEPDLSERRLRGDPCSLRLDMPRAVALAVDMMGGRPLTFRELTMDGAVETRLATPERWGDAVIVRKEVPASYHLAVVVDDAGQGVTHVTRGADLLAATSIHRLLQVLLDLPEPVYHHHRLILDGQGQKLSKSAGATGLDELRRDGLSANDVWRQLDIGLPGSEPGQVMR